MLKSLQQKLGINRVVLAISMARLGDGIGNSILIVVIPLYVAKLPSPWFPFPESVRVGVLISLYGLAAALLQPLTGGITDRLGNRKQMILIGLAIMGLATLGFIIAGNFVTLVGLRLLQGVGVAVTVPAALAIMATATHKESRGGAMGVYSTMRMVGFATGPLIGGFLFEKFGFNSTFVAGTVFIAIGLVMASFLLDPDKAAVKPGSKDPGTHKTKLIDPELLGAGILGAGLASFIMASDFSMISSLENQFNSRLGQGALGFGIAFSALIISRLIFQVPLGNFSDRWGRKPFILIGLILMAPATILLGYVATTTQFTWLRMAQGLASAAIAAPAFALAADVSKEGGEGRQMSVVTMSFALGIAVGPLIAGFLAVYSFTLPFWVGGVLSLLVALVVLLYVPETLERSSQEQQNLSAAEGD